MHAVTRTRRPRNRTGVAASPLRLSIHELAPGGHGVGHAVVAGERRAVFVPRAAIGDELDVLADLSSRPARAKILRVVSPGSGRIEPRCPYVERCGACDWMHLRPEAQREARVSRLLRALPPSLGAPLLVTYEPAEHFGYRTRARLHVRASGGRAVVGLHGAGTRNLVGVETCAVLRPALDVGMRQLGRMLEGAHGNGEAQLALGAGDKPVVELWWDGTLPGAVFGRIEAGVASGTCAGASIHLGDVRRPAVIGAPEPRMEGADGEPLVLAAGGFAQASESHNVTLGCRVAALAREASLERRGRLVELYAGAGNFTVLLARLFDEVVAVESNGLACIAARANLASRGLSARVLESDVDAFVIPRGTDVVVLDPPRTGARSICERLAASRVRAIVYVSCDTATLGRDLSILAENYSAFAVESFAMFPQTSHAEAVVAMRRTLRTAR